MSAENTSEAVRLDKAGGARRRRASKSAGTWSEFYVSAAALLLAFCFPAIWVYAGYRGFSFNQSLSFFIDDGWCVKGVESLGNHCFGDYAALDDGLAAGSLWSPSLPTATPYPALAWAPSIAFVLIGKAVDSWTFGRDLFLIFLGLSMITPAAWAAYPSIRRKAPLTILLLGLGSAPFLVVLDRGNAIGLVVVPLLGLAISYSKMNFGRMTFFIVICALLKPQMILLVLLFLVYKKYGYLLVTVLVAAVTTLAGFALFPSTFPANIANWVTVITRYSDYQGIGALFPYNLGAGRSLLTILELLHVPALIGDSSYGELSIWIQSHNSLLMMLVLVIVGVAIILRKPGSNILFPLLAVLSVAIIAPGTAFSYYLALFLVPAALILRDPRRNESDLHPWIGILDDSLSAGGRTSNFAKGVVTASLALLLTPLVVPLPSFLGLPTNAPTREMVLGLLQVLDGPLILLVLCFSLAMTVGRPKEIAVRTRLAGPNQDELESPGRHVGG